MTSRLSRLLIIGFTFCSLTAFAQTKLIVQSTTPTYVSGGAISSANTIQDPELPQLKAMAANLNGSNDTGLVNVFNMTGSVPIYFDLRDMNGNLVHYSCNVGNNPYCLLNQNPQGNNGERILAANVNVVFFNDQAHTQRLAEFFPLLNGACLNVTVYDNHLKLDQVLNCAK